MHVFYTLSVLLFINDRNLEENISAVREERDKETVEKYKLAEELK